MREAIGERPRPFGLPNLSPDGGGGSGSHVLNLGEYGKLLTLREQVGSIRYPFVQHVIRDSIQFYEQGLLAEIQTDEARRLDISTRFQNYSNRVEAQTGQKPSRAFACSLFVERSICSAMDDRAIKEYQAGRFGSFALWFDASAGAREAVQGVPTLEAAAKGQLAGVYKLAYNLVHEYLTQEQNPQNIKDMEAVAARASELLRQDPTGFLVVDAQVAGIREEVQHPTNQPSAIWIATPEMYLAGAELAQQIYQAIYPLSEGL